MTEFKIRVLHTILSIPAGALAEGFVRDKQSRPYKWKRNYMRLFAIAFHSNEIEDAVDMPFHFDHYTLNQTLNVQKVSVMQDTLHTHVIVFDSIDGDAQLKYSNDPLHQIEEYTEILKIAKSKFCVVAREKTTVDLVDRQFRYSNYVVVIWGTEPEMRFRDQLQIDCYSHLQ